MLWFLFRALTLMDGWQEGHQANRKNHFNETRWWGGSGISWTICKSFAPHSGQITIQNLITRFLRAGGSSWWPTNTQSTGGNRILTCWFVSICIFIMVALRPAWSVYDSWFSVYPRSVCWLKICRAGSCCERERCIDHKASRRSSGTRSWTAGGCQKFDHQVGAVVD